MVCLLRSRLFRETRIPEESFEDVFSRPPVLLLKTGDQLWSFLELCEYFMVDKLPLDDVEPFKKELLVKDPHNIPPHLLFMYTSLCVALMGSRQIVLEHGCYQVLEWVHKNRFKFVSKDYITLLRSDHVESTLLVLIDTLYALGIPPIPYAMELAMTQKKTNVINLLLKQNVELTAYHMSVAIQEDFPITFLEVLVNHQCPIHSYSIAIACSMGYLEIVEWWNNKKFSFCTNALALAALNGHADIVRYLIHHHKPVNLLQTRNNALRSKDPEIIRLISTIVP